MTKWFLALPLQVQIVLIIAVIITVIIVSVYGKLAFTWGKVKVGLGDDSSSEENKTQTKEDCEPCRKSIIDRVQEIDATLFVINRDEMLSKMTMVEHKLISLQQTLLNRYNVVSNRASLNNDNQNISAFAQYVIEPNLFTARVELAMNMLKMEFKRSIKENGFHEKDEVGIRKHIIEQTETVESILHNYLNINYPKIGLSVSYQDIVSILEYSKPFISEMVNDIYRGFIDYHSEANKKRIEQNTKVDALKQTPCETIKKEDKNAKL